MSPSHSFSIVHLRKLAFNPGQMFLESSFVVHCVLSLCLRYRGEPLDSDDWILQMGSKIPGWDSKKWIIRLSAGLWGSNSTGGSLNFSPDWPARLHIMLCWASVIPMVVASGGYCATIVIPHWAFAVEWSGDLVNYSAKTWPIVTDLHCLVEAGLHRFHTLLALFWFH